MYDAETLQLMCLAAGFAEVVIGDWGWGWIQPSPDAPHRREGSLYVEATQDRLIPETRLGNQVTEIR